MNFSKATKRNTFKSLFESRSWDGLNLSTQRRCKMRTLTNDELIDITGGVIKCTIGTSGINCTGSLSDWAAAYESLVGYAADGMCAASGNC
jgi:hypothetical protein